MKNLKFLFVVLAIAGFISASGQSGEQTALDGAYVRETNITRKVIPYPSLREADVMWSKRVWLKIDLREKINHPLYFPLDNLGDRKCLFDVIREGLESESITAYIDGPAGERADEFRYGVDKGVADSLLNPTVIMMVESLDDDGSPPVATPTPAPWKAQDIIAYKLKEDWIFDKQRSERYVRIIGIAPVVRPKAEDGTEKEGDKDLFWLHYPECRYVFNNYDVFNDHNTAQRMTFDQLFQLRMFHGYIIKEDNNYNRLIQDYKLGIDALLESERIKNELFTMEHDLWHY